MGLWGLGAALLSLVRLKFPSPWDQVAALLLGIQTLSLAVQITGILEITSRPVLVTIWLSLVVIGAVMLVNRASQIENTAIAAPLAAASTLLASCDAVSHRRDRSRDEHPCSTRSVDQG